LLATAELLRDFTVIVEDVAAGRRLPTDTAFQQGVRQMRAVREAQTRFAPVIAAHYAELCQAFGGIVPNAGLTAQAVAADAFGAHDFDEDGDETYAPPTLAHRVDTRVLGAGTDGTPWTPPSPLSVDDLETLGDLPHVGVIAQDARLHSSVLDAAGVFLDNAASAPLPDTIRAVILHALQMVAADGQEPMKSRAASLLPRFAPSSTTATGGAV
jgi:hypothetical protein